MDFIVELWRKVVYNAKTLCGKSAVDSIQSSILSSIQSFCKVDQQNRTEPLKNRESNLPGWRYLAQSGFDFS